MKINEIVVSQQKKTIEILHKEASAFLYDYYEEVQNHTNNFSIPVNVAYTNKNISISLAFLTEEFVFLLDHYTENSQVTIMYKELVDYFKS